MKLLKSSLLILFLFTAIPFYAQSRRERTEDNGFKWVEIIDANKKHGAQTPSGKTLIPTRYDRIVYHASSDYFNALSGDNAAVYDRNGNCIISESRGYRPIYKQIDSSDGKVWYSVYRNGKQGACDANGREVIAPTVETDIIWFNGHFEVKNAAGKWVAVTTNGSNSNSSSSATSKTTTNASPGSMTAAQAYDKGMSYFNNNNYSSALPYIRSAADRGYSKAQFRMGYMYHFGKGVSTNYSTAMAWYKKAAAQNNSDALINIGYMYENAQGVAKSLSQAKSYYQKAANLGSELAKKNLAYVNSTTNSNTNSNTKSNTGSNSNNSTRSIRFYNTWQVAPSTNGFAVPGSGMGDYSPVFHISPNRVTATGNYGYKVDFTYNYSHTDNKGNRHYIYEDRNSPLKLKMELEINKDYTSLNLTSYMFGRVNTTTNYVSDPKQRQQIIAQNKGNVRLVQSPNMHEDPTPSTNNNELDLRYPEYNKYKDKNGKWSDKKYKQITRANCTYCHGTGIDPHSQSSASSRSAMHNNRGNKCRICGQYTYHFHDRCPSCS